MMIVRGKPAGCCGLLLSGALSGAHGIMKVLLPCNLVVKRYGTTCIHDMIVNADLKAAVIPMVVQIIVLEPQV